ncbi:MAG: HU family DNA-binding protein [Desulfobacterales bacterium]|nr:HU family DNA-binding protein [Desulfobacterales bacterium]
MTDREEVITKFATKAKVTKVNAGAYLAILLDVIQAILARKRALKLPGFGSFKVNPVPERKGINPLTGKKVTFAPGVRVSFKPGQPLKEAVAKNVLAKPKVKPKAKPKKKKTSRKK